MSTIFISDLSPTGFDLFSDAENYLDELSDSDLTEITGGYTVTIAASPTISLSAIAVTVISVAGSAGYYFGRNKK
jgi:hypothetical protein